MKKLTIPPLELLRPVKLLALLIVATAIHPVANALPEDSQQPINIQADRASQKSSDQGEITEYFGNVQMTQGSMKINGEHIVIHSLDRKVKTIKATGSPARFEQQSDPDKAPVVARAQILDYNLGKDTVILTTNASIKQPGASFSGDRIEYNIAIEQVKARGGKQSGRVNMVLMPDK